MALQQGCGAIFFRFPAAAGGAQFSPKGWLIKMNKKNDGTSSEKNVLTIPLILSLCANLVLVIAIVILALRMSTASVTVSSTDDASDDTETTEEEDEDDDDEDETYYFTDYNDDTVEVTSYAAYIEGEYICAGDATNWVFTYDEDTEANSVYVTEEDGTEIGTYNVLFYATTDETNLVCNLINADDEDESYIYYVITILDDEDSATAVGLYFENATVSDDGFILYLPDAYEEYILNADSDEDEDDTADGEAEDEESEDEAESDEDEEDEDDTEE